MFLQHSNVFANSKHIYLYWLPKVEVYFRVLEQQANQVLSHLTEGAKLQDDVIVNFQFQRLSSY